MGFVKSFGRLISISAALGLTIGGIFVAGGAVEVYLEEPQYAYVSEDLNADGVQDLIIKQRCGLKTPMYGTYNSTGEITYRSGSEMKKLRPDSIIDYDGIEARLNE